MVEFTQKELISKYQDGGWDLINAQKDTAAFRNDAERIIHAANVKYQKLAQKAVYEPGFYSPALQATRAGKIGIKTGMFNANDNIQKLKSELNRALAFLDDKTASITGARQNMKDTAARVFGRNYKRSKQEEINRWNAFNQIINNNPWLIAKKGEVGGWITSDKIQKFMQEYRTEVTEDDMSFKEYLANKIADELDIPVGLIDIG